MENEKIVHLYPPRYILSSLLCLLYFWMAITLKVLEISAIFSCVEVIKCVKFQTPGFKGLKVGIFRILNFQSCLLHSKAKKKRILFYHTEMANNANTVDLSQVIRVLF